MSQILGTKPFPGDLVDYTEAELDFCLEMHALDNPDKFTFTRGNTQTLTDAELRAAWDNVLEGSARMAKLPKMPLEAIRKRSAMLGAAVDALEAAAKA